MVTQKQVKANYEKILELKDLIWKMEHKHESAMHTYLVGSIHKNLPQTHIDAIIEDYKVLKQEVQDKFKELL